MRNSNHVHQAPIHYIKHTNYSFSTCRSQSSRASKTGPSRPLYSTLTQPLWLLAHSNEAGSTDTVGRVLLLNTNPVYSVDFLPNAD